MEATKFHVTEQLCACGCGTAMGSAIVDRGWKFIRGHKAGVAPGRVVPRKMAPRPGPVSAVGMDQVRRFLQENDQLIVQQLEESRNELERLKRDVDITERKITQLMAERPKFRAALNALGSPA